MGYSLPPSDVGVVEFLKDAGAARDGDSTFEIVDVRPHRVRHFRPLLGEGAFTYQQRFHGSSAIRDFVGTL